MLAGARPLVDLLWTPGTGGRAAGYARAEGRIRGAAYGRCGADQASRACRKAYERELRDRLYWHCPRRRELGQGRARRRRSQVARPLGKKGVSPGPTGLAGLRLVVRALESPQIMEQGREALAGRFSTIRTSTAIRDAAFYVYDNTEMLDRPTVAAHLRSLGRKRAVELLETFPVGQPMDPRVERGPRLA